MLTMAPHTCLPILVMLAVMGQKACSEKVVETLCEDLSTECRNWAAQGECEMNPSYMLDNCRKSCRVCETEEFDPLANTECVDTAKGGERQCHEWAWFGECEKNPEYMSTACRKSCGLCTPAFFDSLLCEDVLPRCTGWAEDGRCHGLWNAKKNDHTVNNAYVIEFCPKACNVCDINLDERDWRLNLGLPQTAPDVEDREVHNRVKAKVEETRQYVQSLDLALRQVCLFGHENCARLALSNECEEYADHDIIKYQCAAACQTCDMWTKDDVEIAKSLYAQSLKEYKDKHSSTV